MARKKITSSSPSPYPTVGSGMRMTKEQEAREKQYRAEDALRTLTRAEEIRRDSGLMRDVKAHAREQVKTTQRVLGSKSKRGA